MINIHQLNSKKVLIYGYGKTGKSLFSFFKKKLNSKVKVFDDNLIINKKYAINNLANFNPDYIFLSPGNNIYNNK